VSQVSSRSASDTVLALSQQDGSKVRFRILFSKCLTVKSENASLAQLYNGFVVNMQK